MSVPDRSVPWDQVAAIRASGARRDVFEAVAEKPRTPTEVAQLLDVSRGTVSNHIRWLRRSEPQLVECLTPERPHHRIYGLTEAGGKAAENL